MQNPLIKYIAYNHFIAGILFLALGWFLLEIRGILSLVFISYIIMAALSPVVSWLKRRKIPHVFAVLLAYFSTLLIVIILVFPLVPFFIGQIQALVNKFPLLLDNAASVLGFKLDQAQVKNIVASELDTIGRNAISLTTKVFGGFFSILTILVLSFYLLIDKERIKRDIAVPFPKRLETKVQETLTHIEEKLGAWFRGQIILSLFIGGLTWFALTLLGLDFALPLALIAGILEIVPTIGPIISAIPAVIVALTVSPTLGFIVVLVYIVVQALENNILVPKIMEKAVGLNPVVIIIGVMIGAKLMGVAGALLSVPFMALLIIFFQSIKITD